MAAGYTKRAVKGSLDMGENAALNHERSLFIASMNTADKKEGTDAFVQKRKPNWNDN